MGLAPPDRPAAQLDDLALEFGVKARNSDFELDNDIAPYYSRRIMMDCPDLFDFFEVRTSAADWQTGWDKFKEARLNPAPLTQPVPVEVTDTLPPAKPVQRVTCVGGLSYIVDDSGEVVSGGMRMSASV